MFESLPWGSENSILPKGWGERVGGEEDGGDGYEECTVSKSKDGEKMDERRKVWVMDDEEDEDDDGFVMVG